MSRRTRTVPLALLVAMAAALFTIAIPAAATSAPPGCANANNNTYDKLLGCMTLEGVRAHQQALQDIADENGGTRAAATPGYDASVEYVVDTARKAGWSVTTHEFDFTVAQPIEQHTPIVASYATGGVTGSALGTETDDVTPVDIN